MIQRLSFAKMVPPDAQVEPPADFPGQKTDT